MPPASTPPAGWVATVAPGASGVVVAAYAPGAVSSADLAILAVLVAGFAVLICIELLSLLKRSV